MKAEIKRNDLCLYPLFKKSESKVQTFRDGKDRYSSPENLQSYDWTGKHPVEVAESDKIYYHNHAPRPKFKDLPLRVNGEFHPGLLSPKELQFTYEAVSYILYGITARTDKKLIQNEFDLLKDSSPYKSYWDGDLEHRWASLS